MAQAGASLLAVNPQRTTPSDEVRQVQGKSAPGPVRQIVWQAPQTKPWSCWQAATTVVGQVQVQVWGSMTCCPGQATRSPCAAWAGTAARQTSMYWNAPVSDRVRWQMPTLGHPCWGVPRCPRVLPRRVWDVAPRARAM